MFITADDRSTFRKHLISHFIYLQDLIEADLVKIT